MQHGHSGSCSHPHTPSHLLFLSLLLLFNSLFPDLFKPLTQWLSLFEQQMRKVSLTTENFINIVMIMTSLLSEISQIPLFIPGEPVMQRHLWIAVNLRGIRNREVDEEGWKLAKPFSEIMVIL